MIPLYCGQLGLTLALMTLPFVGWRNWLDWFQIGRDAAGMYSTDVNWVHVSRDLLNIPRRWFWVPEPADEWRAWWGAVLGWGLWLAVVGSTVCLALLRRRQAQAATGPVAAFLLLGAWMSCYHFMYYEILLTALPVLLLFTEPRRYLEPILLAVVPFGRTVAQGGPSAYFEPTLPQNYPPPLEAFPAGPTSVAVLNRLVPSLLVLLLAIEHLFPALNVFVTVKAGVPGIGYTSPDGTISTLLSTPWDAYCLLVLWLWCGWQWVRERPSQPEAPAREPAALASASG